MAQIIDQPKKPQPQPVEAEEDIIELTQVIDEGPSEVVLELSSLEEELDSLDLGSLTAAETPAPEVPPSEEELPLGLEEGDTSPDTTLGDFMADMTAPLSQELPEEVKAALSEDRLRQIVREVVQETVDKLAKELFPSIALEAVQREIEALKKAVAEEETSFA